MKRLLLLLLSVGALAALLAGCGGAKRGEKAQQEVNTLAGLTLTVHDATPKGASYTIQNDAGQMVTLGRDFGVQAEEDGVWYELDHKDMAMTLDLIAIPSGSQETIDIVWESGYGKLSAGHYRIVKPVSAASASVTLAGEFTLE